MIIGVDPHKSSHTATAVDAATNTAVASIRVAASAARHRRFESPTGMCGPVGLWVSNRLVIGSSGSAGRAFPGSRCAPWQGSL